MEPDHGDKARVRGEVEDIVGPVMRAGVASAQAAEQDQAGALYAGSRAVDMEHWRGTQLRRVISLGGGPTLPGSRSWPNSRPRNRC